MEGPCSLCVVLAERKGKGFLECVDLVFFFRSRLLTARSDRPSFLGGGRGAEGLHKSDEWPTSEMQVGSRSRLGLALPLSLDCIPKEAGPAKGQERQRDEFGVFNQSNENWCLRVSVRTNTA